jgi:hypothetical protein
MFKREIISKFYKQLTSYDIDLPTLRTIENLLPIPVNYVKRKFYEGYVRKHI